MEMTKEIKQRRQNQIAKMTKETFDVKQRAGGKEKQKKPKEKRL